MSRTYWANSEIYWQWYSIPFVCLSANEQSLSLHTGCNRFGLESLYEHPVTATWYELTMMDLDTEGRTMTHVDIAKVGRSFPHFWNDDYWWADWPGWGSDWNLRNNPGWPWWAGSTEHVEALAKILHIVLSDPSSDYVPNGTLLLMFLQDLAVATILVEHSFWYSGKTFIDKVQKAIKKSKHTSHFYHVRQCIAIDFMPTMPTNSKDTKKWLYQLTILNLLPH